jgi:hypothetical protein
VRTLLVVAVLLCASPAAAERKWTGIDTGLEITALSLLVVDYIQTTDIVADGAETNAIMGSHGQRVGPGLYFASAAVVHVAAAALLPQPYRRIFQGVTIGIQIDGIHSNWQGGYGISF